MANEILTQDVAVDFKTGTIELNNADGLKKLVADYAKKYEKLVVTEESYSDDKKVRTDLNKLKKALEDKRKEIKRAYNQPLNEFESLIKEIEAPIDGVTTNIKEQTDKFDQQAKDRKQQQIQSFIDEVCSNKGISSENIQIDPRWLNKSTSKKQWQEAASNAIEIAEADQQRVKQDIQMVKTFAETIGVEPEGYVYQVKKGSNANDVIQRMQNDLSIKQAKQEARKANTKEVGNKRVDLTTGELENLIKRQILFTGTEKQFEQLKRFMNNNNIQFVEGDK
ncbi:DUF1351 domain-containing protein [Apilactobacillus timberlakei]|uniref:DUF1351 domain-containing protein n=1 Tax=Apilactobacillus timberlakei TaxID=2008380 RepID=A0ABY2YT47_9LACO|nr:DUF1351 domain-containing protein [Apilactobacillus timberlakei]TPR12768.1 DUF1351 domain-containing protein [Apilactobacillus timberlakei]TPR13651.1 DUF1351 domain-containing protein [Apilactobacillus timberlakei]